MQNSNANLLKTIMRIVSLLITALFFVPSCVVSCATVEIPVSGFNATIGVRYEGDLVADPHVIMVIAVLLPIAMIIVLSQKKPSVFYIILNAVDMVVWLIFIKKAKDTAEQSYCDFKITPWFIIMMVLLLANVVLAVVLLKIDSQPDYGMGSMGGMGGMGQPYMNSSPPPMNMMNAGMYSPGAVPPPVAPEMQMPQEDPGAGAWAQRIAVVCPLSAEHNGMKIPVGNGPLMIGRDPAACALVYGENAVGVSRQHCQITFDKLNGQFVLTDLGSTYGTFLMNGQKLNPNTPCRLAPGETFYVGDPVNMVRVENN